MNVAATKEESVFKQGSKPTLLFNFFLIMGALVSFMLYEAFRLLKEPNTSNLMGGAEFLVTVLGSLLISGLLIYLGHRYFTIKFRAPIAIITSILFLGNLMAVLLFPTVWADPNGVEYVLTGELRFSYILAYGAQMLFMYIFLGMGPQVQKGENGLAFVIEFVIGAALVGIVYSYITEWSKYVNYFSALFSGQAMPPREDIKSYTYICNTYGALLFYGGAAELALHHRDRRMWRLALTFFFYLNCIVVQSKTTTISFGLMFFLYLILDGFILIKEKKRLHGYILLSLLSIFVIVSTILYFTPSNLRAFVNNFWDNYVLDKGSSFASRVRIWKDILKLLISNPARFVFGLGHINYMYVTLYTMSYWPPTAAAHNGFVEVLGRGGIIALLAYLAFLVYFAVIFIKLVKRQHTRHYWYYVIFLIAFFARSMAESEALISPDWNGIIACAFGVFPVLSAYYGMGHNDDEKAKEFKLKTLFEFAYHMLPGVVATIGFVLVSLGISLALPFLTGLGLLAQIGSFIWMGVKSKRNNGVFICLVILAILDIYLFSIHYILPMCFFVDKVFMATVNVVNFYGVGIISSIFIAELLPIKDALDCRDIIEARYALNRW